MQAPATPSHESHPLLVDEVVDLARDFISRDLARREGFWGAYLAGAINRMDRRSEVPPYLSVDIHVVLESAVREEIEALQYDGYLLACNLTPSRDYGRSESMLALPDKAGHFVGNRILADPHRRLSRLQDDVAASFNQRRWVQQRVASSLASAKSALAGLRAASDAVEALRALSDLILYASAGLMVAHLAPPMHRRALVDLKTLLEMHGGAGLHGRILATLGSQDLDASETRRLLGYCLAAFDRGLAVKRQPVPSGWVLVPCLRAHLQDGTLALIDQGAHREGIFWLLRFLHVAITAVRQDGSPQDQVVHGTHLMRFLAALGLDSASALRERVHRGESLVAEIERYTTAFVETSPLLTD